jgi:hypothetical protein
VQSVDKKDFFPSFKINQLHEIFHLSILIYCSLFFQFWKKNISKKEILFCGTLIHRLNEGVTAKSDSDLYVVIYHQRKMTAFSKEKRIWIESWLRNNRKRNGRKEITSEVKHLGRKFIVESLKNDHSLNWSRKVWVAHNFEPLLGS